MIGLLSVTKMMRFPDQLQPHVRAAAVIAKSSLYEMDCLGDSLGQDPWIQSFLNIAPYPMSDASVYRRRSEARIAEDGGIIVQADQVGRKSSHHCMSALASLFNVM